MVSANKANEAMKPIIDNEIFIQEYNEIDK